MLLRALLAPLFSDRFTDAVVAITIALPAAYQCWLGYALQGLILHGEPLSMIRIAACSLTLSKRILVGRDGADAL